MLEPRRLATYFKALADPTRLCILELLVGQEMCVCELMAALNLPQPLVSHHLRVLRQAGVVRDDRCGRWICYRLTPEFVAVFRGVRGPRCGAGGRDPGKGRAALGRAGRPLGVRRLRERCATPAEDPRPGAPGTGRTPAAAEPERRV